MVVAIEQVHSAFTLARQHTSAHIRRQQVERCLLRSAQTPALGIGKHFFFALGFGGVMTLPFALSCDIPHDSCLLLFLPYSGMCAEVHKLVYVVVYSTEALLLVVCLMLILLTSAFAMLSAISQGWSQAGRARPE